MNEIEDWFARADPLCTTCDARFTTNGDDILNGESA